jgi:hypothetical protein
MARRVHPRRNMRPLALLLALTGCGLERLSSDVFLHQRAAADYAAAGDERRAEAERAEVVRKQEKLQRRASRVPPTPYP